ncbi:MAG TPA: hypothetical protein VK509_01500 [Polyangiales bacterium]|nr:hypothetical protein [Polyangiales bacterium]
MSANDLDPQEYIGPMHPTRAALGDLTDNWSALELVLATLTTRSLRRVSFTVEWDADAGTAGDIRVEVSDDPRAAMDLMRVNSLPAYTPLAVWNEITYPSGSTDGTNVTVTGKNATIAATAGKLRIDLTDPHAFTRLKWVGTGGIANQLRASVSGLGR